jgi:hypothetical protein
LLLPQSNPKSKSPFQLKDAKKETPKENTKILKTINDYEIKCVYKINIEGYYKNFSIYREKMNK